MALVCGNFPAAEDAVQEALARAWELSERGQHIDSLVAWVTKVARNLLRDRFRRILVDARARGRLAPRDAVSQISAVEDRADMAMALARLTRRQREVAVFHYYLDLGVAEIAAALQIPEGTVKSTLHRARRSLADALGTEADTTEVGDVAR
jgi:RNA polymerase sigma-70 factor (ECF subfamily)